MAGGKVRAYTANFAQMSQTSLDDNLGRFTAFNDSYHKGTNSRHATGNAFDFTLKDASKSAQAVSQLESLAKRYGFVVRVLDEYRNPSKRATGGHIHVSVLGYKGSAEALKDASAELEIVKKFNDDATKIREEAAKKQLSVRSKYFTELEKIEYENEEAIKDINVTFANDDAARNKYLELQKKVYQKDIAEFRKAQWEKLNSAQFGVGNIYQDLAADKLMTQNPNEYARWSLQNQYGENLGGLSEAYTSNYQSIQDDPLLDEKAKNAQLLEAENEYLMAKAALNAKASSEELKLSRQIKDQKLSDTASMLNYASSSWGQLTDIIGKRQGEQSKSYKAMFAMQKAMAIASATINTYLAISQAWADPSLPFYAKIAASVVAGASGLAQVIAISQQEPSGFADGGFTGYGSKYQVGGVVHKGEVVWSQEDIKRWGGVSIVESMRKGSPNGFADGGVVTGDILGGIDIGYKPKASYSKGLENTSSQQPQINIFNSSQARVNANTNEDGSVTIEVVEAHLLNALSNPNSRISKGISTYTTAGRRR